MPSIFPHILTFFTKKNKFFIKIFLYKSTKKRMKLRSEIMCIFIVEFHFKSRILKISSKQKYLKSLFINALDFLSS